ncbi:MAG: hypothetical protein WEC75_06140 [Dehalococcoidia bacterium]
MATKAQKARNPKRRHNRSDGRGQTPASADESPQSPGPLGFEKANKALKKLVHENAEWLKEMAKR